MLKVSSRVGVEISSSAKKMTKPTPSAAAREFGPDLVLLDVMMPRLEGSEVAAMIRADRQLHDVRRSFFLTSLVSEADAPGGSYISGGHVFLPKSLPIVRLIECINQSLAEQLPIAAV